MAGFPFDTFVVLDMPPHVEHHVRDIRRRYGSARQYLPVEVTVAGSSGVGPFDPDQDADAALRRVAEVAAATAPFSMTLGPVERFPDSDVFYWAIRDPAPLVMLHGRLRDSGIRFTDSPFPFSPHLTVDAFEAASDDLVRELLALPVPAGPFPVSSLSVYALEGWICHTVAHHPLSG